ncbi:hypothetical protein C0966_04455 [Bacillus methanolicus]|uniref:hypothetical protein n=1 Tax=Bacillus methanolicus TaxID=1471 RepID=UPI002380A7B5|nr:hypothetical protein [Bacillus methanolicus]MDE3838640.1 hypothetical protein [Bacillus methanolicus]
MNKKQHQFFYCYNKKVSDFLKEQGVECITVAKDIKKDQIFSLYIIDDKLQAALDAYDEYYSKGDKVNE